MILILLFSVLIIYISFVFYKKWTVFNYLLSNFNSPPRHPILGVLHLFPRDVTGIFQTFQGLIKTYGKNFVFSRPILDALIVVADPKDAEAILANPNTKKAKKSRLYKTIEPWLGTGLLTSYGEKWFTRRKIITPGFHFSILDGFVEVMEKQSDVFVERLRPKAGVGDFDIYPLVNAFTLDVICETSMGVKVNAQSNPSSEYVTSVKKMTQSILAKIHHPLAKAPLIYDLTANGRYLKILTNILHNFTNKVISERRNQIRENGTHVSDKGNRMNFLDILLHATIDGKPLSNDDIREEVDTFMFEGHDTTASGIAFTLHLLSQHHNVQNRVYSELLEIFGSKDEMDVTCKKLNELTYLEMVLKESLRLYPPVPSIGRQLLEDTVIGGVVVPAYTNISLQIYFMHHDPDNFEDPEKFDPERFVSYDSEKKNNFAYVPFSAGGRNCIGQKFAMLDMKACVAKVLMNYRLLPGTDVIVQGDLILKSENGMRIRLQER